MHRKANATREIHVVGPTNLSSVNSTDENNKLGQSIDKCVKYKMEDVC